MTAAVALVGGAECEQWRHGSGGGGIVGRLWSGDAFNSALPNSSGCLVSRFSVT